MICRNSSTATSAPEARWSRASRGWDSGYTSAAASSSRTGERSRRSRPVPTRGPRSSSPCPDNHRIARQIDCSAPATTSASAQRAGRWIVPCFDGRISPRLLLLRLLQLCGAPANDDIPLGLVSAAGSRTRRSSSNRSTREHASRWSRASFRVVRQPRSTPCVYRLVCSPTAMLPPRRATREAGYFVTIPSTCATPRGDRHRPSVASMLPFTSSGLSGT